MTSAEQPLLRSTRGDWWPRARGCRVSEWGAESFTAPRPRCLPRRSRGSRRFRAAFADRLPAPEVRKTGWPPGLASEPRRTFTRAAPAPNTRGSVRRPGRDREQPGRTLRLTVASMMQCPGRALARGAGEGAYASISRAAPAALAPAAAVAPSAWRPRRGASTRGPPAGCSSRPRSVRSVVVVEDGASRRQRQHCWRIAAGSSQQATSSPSFGPQLST
jgi:hypothetical protein